MESQRAWHPHLELNTEAEQCKEDMSLFCLRTSSWLFDNYKKVENFRHLQHSARQNGCQEQKQQPQQVWLLFKSASFYNHWSHCYCFLPENVISEKQFLSGTGMKKRLAIAKRSCRMWLHSYIIEDMWYNIWHCIFEEKILTFNTKTWQRTFGFRIYRSFRMMPQKPELINIL